MDGNGVNLGARDVLICGQLKTSRTETLEHYLKPRTRFLGVIGVLSPFARGGRGRCTLYRSGERIKERSLPQFLVPAPTPLKKPLILLSFCINVLVIFSAARKLGRRFDVFVGIATFSALMGVFLKKLGKVDRVVYYCLDYYSGTTWFDRGFCYFVRKVDAWLVKQADTVWDISPRIRDAREEMAGVPVESYERLVVPLGYAEGFERSLPLHERERWTLGFVGTLTENQGLDLVIDALPELLQLMPEIKVRVIGHGPDRARLEKRVQQAGLADCLLFHGFVEEDEEVNDILSRCRVGLATWTGGAGDNSLYADPGKPKLYALLGLPILISQAPLISQTIHETGAGEAIPYEKDAFVSAVRRMLEKEEGIAPYLEGLERFKPLCRAPQIFDQAFAQTLNSENGSASTPLTKA